MREDAQCLCLNCRFGDTRRFNLPHFTVTVRYPIGTAGHTDRHYTGRTSARCAESAIGIISKEASERGGGIVKAEQMQVVNVIEEVTA